VGTVFPAVFKDRETVCLENLAVSRNVADSLLQQLVQNFDVFLVSPCGFAVGLATINLTCYVWNKTMLRLA